MAITIDTKIIDTKIDGLQKILIRNDSNTPEAFFVFESAEKANIAFKAVSDEFKMTVAMAGIPGKRYTEEESDNYHLLDILRDDSEPASENVLGYMAKSMGGVGAPITTCTTLYTRIVKSINWSYDTPSKTVPVTWINLNKNY